MKVALLLCVFLSVGWCEKSLIKHFVFQYWVAKCSRGSLGLF